MSAGQHTPGPWLIKGQTVYALDETGNCNRFSAQVLEGWKSRGEGVFYGAADRTSHLEISANARLIAAAPELLAALEKLSALRPSNYQDDDELATAYEVADLVIAKARGQ